MKSRSVFINFFWKWMNYYCVKRRNVGGTPVQLFMKLLKSFSDVWQRSAGCLQVSLEQWIIASSKKILITRPMTTYLQNFSTFSYNMCQIFLKSYEKKIKRNFVKRLSQFCMTNRFFFFKLRTNIVIFIVIDKSFSYSFHRTKIFPNSTFFHDLVKKLRYLLIDIISYK